MSAVQNEALVIGALLAHPELLDRYTGLEIDDFVTLRGRLPFEAMRNLQNRGDRITVDAVIAQLGERANGLSDGSVDGPRGYLEIQVSKAKAPIDVLQSRVDQITDEMRVRADQARERAAAVARQVDAEHQAQAEVDAEIDEFALRDVAPDYSERLVATVSAMEAEHERRQQAADAQKPRPRWRRCRDFVDEIIARASEPWVALQLDGVELVSVRAGGIALLIGGTGRGKTSLAASLLRDHAQRCGPALAFSLELPGDEWSARAASIGCDASWSSVLKAEVPAGHMLQALPERLAIVERDKASLKTLGDEIESLRAEYPGEPCLVAVDYVQLVGADDDDDIRPRIGKVMRELDRIARDKRVVVIALSQGSRASTRTLSSGEVLGAATADTGAESADLERWATVTLAIGQHGTLDDDAVCPVDLSIGKSRMGGGDRVVPARFHGRSGRFETAGDARPAGEVKAERDAQRNQQKVEQMAHTMAGVLGQAADPISRAEAKRRAGRGDGSVKTAAIQLLIDTGRAVRVRGKKSGGCWPVWTPDKAAASGIALVPDGEDG